MLIEVMKGIAGLIGVFCIIASGFSLRRQVRALEDVAPGKARPRGWPWVKGGETNPRLEMAGICDGNIRDLKLQGIPCQQI